MQLPPPFFEQFKNGPRGILLEVVEEEEACLIRLSRVRSSLLPSGKLHARPESTGNSIERLTKAAAAARVRKPPFANSTENLVTFFPSLISCLFLRHDRAEFERMKKACVLARHEPAWRCSRFSGLRKPFTHWKVHNRRREQTGGPLAVSPRETNSF